MINPTFYELSHKNTDSGIPYPESISWQSMIRDLNNKQVIPLQTHREISILQDTKPAPVRVAQHVRLGIRRPREDLDVATRHVRQRTDTLPADTLRLTRARLVRSHQPSRPSVGSVLRGNIQKMNR